MTYLGMTYLGTPEIVRDGVAFNLLGPIRLGPDFEATRIKVQRDYTTSVAYLVSNDTPWVAKFWGYELTKAGLRHKGRSARFWKGGTLNEENAELLERARRTGIDTYVMYLRNLAEAMEKQL